MVIDTAANGGGAKLQLLTAEFPFTSISTANYSTFACLVFFYPANRQQLSRLKVAAAVATAAGRSSASEWLCSRWVFSPFGELRNEVKNEM